MHNDGDRIGMWRTSMTARGLSPRTIGEHVRILTASRLDPATCTVSDIETWLASTGRKPSTRRAYSDALRAFFGWQQQRGLRRDNPTGMLPRVKVPPPHPHPSSTADVLRLVAAARRRRLRGYLLLAAYQGLRVSEIARVRGCDIEGGVLVVAGKGGRVRRLPLHPAVAAYAAGMPDGWWFPAYTHDGPVTAKNVSRSIGDHMRRCRVEGSAHWLRHWFASQLALTAPLQVVREGLGHSSVATTQIYTAVDSGQLRAAVARLPTAA